MTLICKMDLYNVQLPLTMVDGSLLGSVSAKSFPCKITYTHLQRIRIKILGYAHDSTTEKAHNWHDKGKQTEKQILLLQFEVWPIWKNGPVYEKYPKFIFLVTMPGM